MRNGVKIFTLLFIILHPFFAAYPQTLVGHWKLNEGSGSTLIDASGNGNNATLQNPKDITWVVGIENLALSFPGTTNRFAVAPNSASLNITNAITITAWIRPVDVSTRYIISKTTPDGYTFAISKTGKIEFKINPTTNANTYRLVSNTSFPATGTTWMHVAATFDGTNSRIYINGVLDASATYSSPVTIKTNTSPLYIGALGTSGRWKGAMDDLRLYNGALSASEINAIKGGVSVPGVPTLLAPANTAIDIPANSTFQWSAVAGASKFRLEISESSTFTTAFLTQDNIIPTSFAVTGLLANKTYFWRVRASNTAGDGGWSPAWNFSTVKVAPSAPTLASPPNGAINIAYNPTLSWNSVSDATKYKIELSDTVSFSRITSSQSNVITTSASFSGLAAAKTYFWRVSAGNAGGDSPWSTVWNFTTVPLPPDAPVLTKPLEGASSVPVNTTFEWNSVSGASSYGIQISESSSFATTFLSQDNISSTTLAVSNLLPGMLYYWRVRSANAGGSGSWSIASSFTTAAATTTATLFHYWNFNNSAALLSPSLTLAGASMTLDLAALSTIEAGTAIEFVGLNARNGDPAGTHLRLNNPIGSVLNLNVPTNGFKDIVVKYETRRSTQGSEIQKISYSVDGTSFTFLKNHLAVNGNPTLVTLDFTALAACNDNPNFKIKIEFEQGAGGTTGNDRIDNLTFDGTPTNAVVVPGQAVTLTPADNQQEVPARPTLTWESLTGAATYDVQVATDNAFSNVVASKSVTGATSYKLESLLSAATNYYWRVRGVNSAGAGVWSSTKTFKTVLVLLTYNLAVNEVMSSNNGSIKDEDGAYSDWVEIVNYGSNPINLSGFGLSDTYAAPFKWVFPAKTLAPGQFLIVWASSKNRVDPSAPLHTNFAISASGEDVVLTAPDGETVDALPSIAIPTNVSRGHQPDGMGPFLFFPIPTPGSTNSGGVASFLSTPSFSLAPGVYTTAQTVSITHPDATVVIRYTLDGSEPSANSPQYTAPLQIADRSGEPNAQSMIPTNYVADGSRAWREPEGLVRKGTVIRAKAFKNSTESSGTLTGSYIINTGRQFTFPVVSVVSPHDSLFGFQRGIYVPGVNYISGLDNTGNYYLEGDAWERPGSIEFFMSDGSIQQNVGFRINGGYTRRFPQKSLRVVMRSEYGKSTLDYPLFKNYNIKSFKRLVLRNSGNDWGHTMFKDAVAHMLVSHIMPIQHYQPSVLFLNGEYWGIHNIRERTDKYFVASIYGADPDNVDYLTLQNEIQDGDDVNYREMLAYIQSHDLSSEDNYTGLKTRMDVENFTDYYAAEIYYGNHDWPQGNIDFWRERVPYNPAAPAGRDGRWRWLFFDIDLAFEAPDANSISRLLTQINPEKNAEWPNFLLRNLVRNQGFKTNFINRIADQLNTAFVPARVTNTIDSIAAIVQPEIAEHGQRWSRPSSVSNWQQDVDVMKVFANSRPDYVRNYVKTEFALGSSLTVTLNISDKSHGSINLNSLVINSLTKGLPNPSQPFPWQGVYFGNVPITLQPMPNRGYAFDHWEINGISNTTEKLTYTPTASVTIKAVFVPSTGVTPVLTSPANASATVPVSPAVFTWEPVSGSTGYRLQISRTTDFLNPVFDQSGIATSTKDVNGLLNGALYYWRVMATVSGGKTNWSDVWSFTAAPLALPGPVTLVSPADGSAGVALNVNLTWNTSSDATFYTVQISSASTFATLVLNQDNVTNTSLPASGILNGQTYYWRVRGNNVRGSSDWSAARSFTTIALSNKLLVGHWPMEENGGSTLNDNSGFSNNAALQNPKDIAWVTGVKGLALNMPGTTLRYAIAPNSSSLNITDAITIAAWIRPIELSTRTILSKINPDGYELRLNTSNKIEFRINENTNGSAYRIASNANYPFNGTTWMHVAATFDGTTSKIYINGVLDKSVTFSAPITIKPNTSPLYIASSSDSYRWKGGLDELRLYRGALDASEIAQIASTTSAASNEAYVVIPERQDGISIYPNPVRETINLQFNFPVEGEVTVSMVDALGRTHFQTSKNVEGTHTQIEIGKEVKPGIYLLFVKSGVTNRSLRLVKE